MSDNSQKTPFQRTVNETAQKRTADAQQLEGKSLPCVVKAVNGWIVTVAFDVTTDYTLPEVTMPLEHSAYERPPVQVGDKGIAKAASARLHGISGLGTGTADLSVPANLSALSFQLIGNANFHVDDPNAHLITGPNGFVLTDNGGACKLTGGPNGVSLVVPNGKNLSVSISGGGTVTIDLGGGTVNLVNGNVNLTGGDVVADGISLKNHVHGGVQPGDGNTGAPVS